MFLGPLFSGQSRAVAEAVGRGTPVVSLSNDSSIAGDNLFVFGITPQQSAKSILGFAATRGKRNVVTVVPPGPFGALSAQAAQSVAAATGGTAPAAIVASSAAGLIDKIRAANGGALPDAVYLPVVGGPLKNRPRRSRARGYSCLAQSSGPLSPLTGSTHCRMVGLPHPTLFVSKPSPQPLPRSVKPKRACLAGWPLMPSKWRESLVASASRTAKGCCVKPVSTVSSAPTVSKRTDNAHAGWLF